MARNNILDKRKTVVAVRFSALGDIAMTLPSLYNAALSNPEFDFIFVTRKAFTSIFVNRPENLTVEGVDLNGDYSGPSGMYRLFRKLKNEHGFDMFIDLHDVLRTKILRMFCRLSGIRVVSIDKGRDDKRRLTRRNGKILTQLRPMTLRYADTFLRAGLAVGDSFHGLFNGPCRDEELIAAVTAPKTDAAEHWIGIAPFAKHKGKIYPPELMEKVVERLVAAPKYRLFLFGGGGDEAAVLSSWAEKYPRVVSLAGRKLGFKIELALLSNLDLVVSMDSGNMHLASLVGVPVVSVWGATHPYCGFAGWHQTPDNVIQLPMPCRPCSVFGDKKCMRGDYLCLAGISPTLIVDKIHAVIGAL